MNPILLVLFEVLLFCSVRGSEIAAEDLVTKGGFDAREYTPGRPLDFSGLTPVELEALRQTANRLEAPYKPYDASVQAERAGLFILVKFGDPDSLQFLRKLFRLGDIHAESAAALCAKAGELSLIPLAAETLFTDKPERTYVRKNYDVIHASPAGASADAIQAILAFNPRVPESVRKGAAALRPVPGTSTELDAYRRWWHANREDVTAITSPLQFKRKP